MGKAFQADYKGIGELLVSPQMQAHMLARAEQMKAAAVADAPFDPNDKDGDHYKDHFYTESGVQHHKTSRAYGLLGNNTVSKTSARGVDVSVAFLVEFGSKNNPAHHTILRSIDAARDGL